MKILFVKELGLEILGKEVFMKVDKKHFESAAVAYTAYRNLNDEGYKILIKEKAEWKEKKISDLEEISKKVRIEMARSLKRKKYKWL